MIDFTDAVRIAKDSITTLQPDARNIKLEEVILSEDDLLYQVTLSYDFGDKAEQQFDNPSGDGLSNLARLAALMQEKRQHKVFLVSHSDGVFKGFRDRKGG